MEGMIFEVREFCLHDGEGVRTTVFLKGCPLRCSWCHNPEGQSGAAETLRGRPCGRRIEAAALAAELLRQKDFFLRYGGGITFSGGEPFAQAAFLEELSGRLRPPLHLAAETSGHVPPEEYRRAAAAVDFLYQDLKHWDPAAFRKHCRGDLSLVLENLGWLKTSGKPHIVRIPLIPGVNDLPEAGERFAALLEGDPSLQGVELLPYHRTAAAKYRLMGRPYRPGFDTSAPVRAPSPAPFLKRGIPATLV